MAATELLDFNQVVEQSSTNGDVPSASGGLMSWNFRCDPNLAWDPSQSFFAMDVTFGAKTGGVANANGTYPTWSKDIGAWHPDFMDFYPFFPLRAFSSMTHIIDGVTVAHTNQPYADKIMQEKYLHDTSLSNYSNFESLMLARAIDDFEPTHNMFFADHFTPGTSIVQDGRAWVKNNQTQQRVRYAGNGTYTILFQPPFDLWTKHQRISGGNHQIQLDLKASTARYNDDGSFALNDWGAYFNTGAGRMSDYALSATFVSQGDIGYINDVSQRVVVDVVPDPNPNGYKTPEEWLNAIKIQNTNGGSDKSFWGTFNKALAVKYGGGDIYTEDTVQMRQRVYNMGYKCAQIESIRLMRRMVRFTIERPIGMEEFNCTEMAFFTGTPSTSSMTQNFLLPSSTFGIAFYWRDASNSYYDIIDDYAKIYTAPNYDGNGDVVDIGTVKTSGDWRHEQNYLNLNNFYFTYGGQTYPAQRISNIYGNSSSGVGPGCVKMHAITHMLQGVMNTDQERYNTSFAGAGLLDRMDASSFFFPVAKHNNSDNSDLQVTWEGGAVQSINGTAVTGPYKMTAKYAGANSVAALMASLVVVAFYDSRVELAYNAANQLEKVTKTEWK